METQRQDTSLYIGTFQNSREVNIDRSNFTINHNTIKRESNTDINIKRLYEHISTAALHNSRERAQEVPETEIKNIVHEWSSRLRTLPTTISTPTESSVPLSSPFDRLSTDDALYDIFKWLYDPFTSYSVVWMHGNTRTQALLLANALAHILHQHRLLSASYFFSAVTDSASIVPTIAYQLAQNITQATVPIARAVDQNLAVFTSRCCDQVEQLIVDPLRNASDLSNEFFEAPKVIIIHGLEDYSDNDNFHISFLDSLTRAVVSLEVTPFPQKLLVLGRYTDRLQECFSHLASQLPVKIIQRPIHLHNLLEKEHEICRKEKEIEKRDKALANKEKSINARVEALRRGLRSQEVHLKTTEEKVKQEQEKHEGALRCREEEIMSQERDLEQRGKELEKRERALRCRDEEITCPEQLKRQEQLPDNKEKSINARAEALHRELRLQEAQMEEKVKQRGKELEKREGALRHREEEMMTQERDLKQRGKELEKREGALRRHEEEMMTQERDLKQRGKELEKREGALRCREEEIISQEQELKKRQEEMPDTTRRREVGLGGKVGAEHEGVPVPSIFNSQEVRNSML